MKKLYKTIVCALCGEQVHVESDVIVEKEMGFDCPACGGHEYVAQTENSLAKTQKSKDNRSEP
ncbi:hypothetical protein [Pseudoalteromonas piscicida]|uniref:Uncharacterized protein n=1 Tax=Pseudoalteromonas piscicida TaxID=43662 RepID=A0A2A5JWI2_PSEO7|nr:hypothetical protein [Pseudoalteromonas piscicida]PCK33671.1 hypothetical protein CEX98_00655 [Pseudoalteromonas piscicida]